MKREIINLSRRYQSALRNHLRQGCEASLDSARGLGGQALSAGMQTLDLAKLHEETLVSELLPSCPANKRAQLIKQAGIFFAIAIVPIEEKHHRAKEAATNLKRFVEVLSQRTLELAASNLELSLEITRRKAGEEELKKSRNHYEQLLRKSQWQQEELRRLSRQVLSAQEDERREISRELHDVIAQTLTGINIRLANLRKKAVLDSKSLNRNIASTQRMVEKSVDIVHRFARELRPAVLDDLGLIPALHSFLKSFMARTGVHAQLTAFGGVENLNTDQRTVLFRVAQEALNNVARHAHASQVDVSIRKAGDSICMTVKDNGKSFNVENVMHANGGKRLGLLGMRERVEMIRGKLNVASSPGQGTTIEVQIPFGRKTSRKTLPTIAAATIF